MNHPLTGNTRFRAGGLFNRRLILQVQIAVPIDGSNISRIDWRDAVTSDLGQLTSLAFHEMKVNVQVEAKLPEVPGARKLH